uniref:Uncharacterized protein n=1 Tax=Cacopsylla melanoneura TaxID=428564 RepID=A0A8D8XW36_9HEMI
MTCEIFHKKCIKNKVATGNGPWLHFFLGSLVSRLYCRDLWFYYKNPQINELVSIKVRINPSIFTIRREAGRHLFYFSLSLSFSFSLSFLFLFLFLFSLSLSLFSLSPLFLSPSFSINLSLSLSLSRSLSSSLSLSLSF